MSGVCAAAVCALVLAGPVQVIGSGPAAVELMPTERGYAVIYRNRIVRSLTVEKWVVDLPGLTVSGVIAARDGDLPDDLVVTPPVGWWCDPCTVTVDENAEGRVELWPEVAA